MKKINLNLLFMLLILIVLFGILRNPKLSLNSALSGISTWVNIILPSLLPFFIITEILIGLGFIDFIGKLLTPIMTPLFNVPGEGIFPLSMSILSGYPIGVKLTSRLREEKVISQIEASRLICFTSTSGPLFILGAVSVGMLNDPKLGQLIIIPHYVSILILGILFRFYKANCEKTPFFKPKNFSKEIKNSYIYSVKTKKSISSLITKAIKESMDSIILIGGLVIFYSVIVEILFSISLVNSIMVHFSNLFKIDYQTIKGIIIGFFEMTLGCKNISNSQAPLIHKIIMLNFIIGWSGLSIHSQALSFINNTDIKPRLYIFSKFCHGLFSAIIGYGLYIVKFKEYIQPAIYHLSERHYQFNIFNWLNLIVMSIKLSLVLIILLLILSFISYILFKPYN